MTAKLNIYSVFYVGGFSKFLNVPDTIATLGVNRRSVVQVDVFSVHVSRDVSRYRAIAKRLVLRGVRQVKHQLESSAHPATLLRNANKGVCLVRWQVNGEE